MNEKFLSWTFPGNFREISRKLLGNLWGVSRKCPGHFPDCSWKFPGNFSDISSTNPGIFPEIFRTFPGIFPDNFLEKSGKSGKSYVFFLFSYIFLYFPIIFLYFPIFSYLNGGPFLGALRGAPGELNAFPWNLDPGPEGAVPAIRFIGGTSHPGWPQKGLIGNHRLNSKT